MLYRPGALKCIALEKEIDRLEAKKKSFDLLIEVAETKLKQIRSECQHQADKETTDHYVTYCRLCGYGMDTWL